MNKSHVMAALTLLALAGCASVPFPLVKSNAPDAAKVRIVDATGREVVLFPPNECNHGYRLTEDDYVLYPIAVAGGFSHQQAAMLGTVPEGSGAVTEFSIAPGQTVNLGATCLGVGSFTARASTQYEVVVRRRAKEHAYDEDRCITSVSTLSLQNGQVVRTPFADVRPMVCKAF
jgi:hypothetical protein